MAWDGLSFLNCRALLPVSFLPNLPHPSHEQGGPQNKLLLTTLYSTHSAMV